MKLEKDTTISHYKILSEIGKGGMGEVYLAHDTKLNRQVAIKFLSDEFSKDADKLNRFVQEAQAASALNHPNILTIHEIGEIDGTNYIATEFIEGETLNEYIKANSIKLGSVLDIAIQIASALDEAHAAGIVHRDIKPDNIMVRENGLAKILDFGIAKLTEKQSPEIESEDATAIQVNTTPGMIIGTANYMSPEQAKGIEVDARTDIFSFGVVLYEMIAGYLPFEGETPMEIIAAIINKEPKPLDSSDVPPEIEKIISKAFRKDRNERYQTIKGLLADLKEVKRELEFQDKLEKTVSPDKEEPKTQMFKATTIDDGQQTTTANDSIAIKKSSFKKIAVGVLAILLISAIGFGYWYFTNESNQIDSIAVMPFVNESGNEDLEYLSDGMTETLISSLSNLPNLNVKARSSVFRYKGKNTDAKTIGKELNVQAILNGRIVQRGDQLTLNLELMDAQTENVIWSDKYDRQTSDLVTLQSEIAKDVSTKLKSKLSGTDEAKVANISTTNPEAYQAYLRGRYYWNKRTGESLKKAIEQFEIAVEKDPNYALAYVGLADSYGIANEYFGTPLNESLPKAEAYAKKAIELDDSLGHAYATLGLLNLNSWNWTESEKNFKRAIELDPKYPTAHMWYSGLLYILGRNDEALAEIKRAQELDPLSLLVMVNFAVTYYEIGDFESALEKCNEIIEIDPSFEVVHFQLAFIYLAQRSPADALAALESVSYTPVSKDISGLAYAQQGKQKEALAIVKELKERYEKGERGRVGTFIAAIYAEIGDKDKAFTWLEKEFQDQTAHLSSIKTDVLFKPLRDDPRYKDLLKRMNLPE